REALGVVAGLATTSRTRCPSIGIGFSHHPFDCHQEQYFPKRPAVLGK
ncbi:MAG: hypothetical protein ACI9G1_002977, partial [Pirellulaceae bacterium]